MSKKHYDYKIEDKEFEEQCRELFNRDVMRRLRRKEEVQEIEDFFNGNEQGLSTLEKTEP